MMTTKPIRAWWLSGHSGYASGAGDHFARLGLTAELPAGRSARVNLCGYHGYRDVFGALSRGWASTLWVVELSGDIDYAPGVYAASERTYIDGGVDIEPVLREFAVWCALDVVRLWRGPRACIERLMAGDESAALGVAVAAKDAARAYSITGHYGKEEAASAAVRALDEDVCTAALDASSKAANARSETFWTVMRPGGWRAAEARYKRRLARMVTEATGLHL